MSSSVVAKNKNEIREKFLNEVDKRVKEGTAAMLKTAGKYLLTQL